MAAQNHAPNSDLFDVYFRRADLDRDGRISGSEAVSFFQGSGLPQNVLAQIWTHADRNRIGFLGRAEFYNALKLVTVAQSKRELTPGMVEAALYGPPSSQIPAPQINLAATAPPQINTGTGTSSPASQMGTSAQARSQNPGFSGAQVTPNSNLNQQYIPSQGSQLMRPPQAVPGYASRPMQGVTGQGFPGGGGSVAGPHLPNSTGALAGITSQVSNRGVGPFPGQDGSGTTASGLAASRPPRPPASSGLVPSVSSAKDSKAPNVSGNGFASDSIFGADVFSAVQTQTKQDSSVPTFSTGSRPVSSAIVPSTSGGQTSVKPNPPDFVQSSVAMQPVGGQLQTTHSLMKQNQQSSTQSISTFSSAGVGAGHPVSGQSQISWPKITQSDIQKYTKVFVEVDTDRDGKITGEQARNLFLSWRLPREVLKQVWDLSDQDNDSMLSLKEFCTALYLMERYREGRPIPSVLPSSIMSDFPPAGQPTSGYSNSAWGPSSGWQQQQRVPGPAARQVTPAEEVRQSVPVASHEADDGMQMKQQKSKVPVLEKNLADQLSKEEQESLNSKFHEATEAEKKVEELEKEILDSKEKIEFYRAKMQELVLYKSRCDNRLNEITERVSGDKREVELLAKKYEEKCKQVGDVASKLTIEEATFRDIQERKMELYQAVVKMSQDGTADGILQVRADRIQSDLDELLKGLNDRCKKYGLRVKPTALVELPFGWQPGIQQGAADWDEDWDKFEDEGFSFVKELTQDVQNIIAPPKPKSTSAHEEKNSVESSKVASTSNADAEPEKPPNMDGQVHENGSASNQKEDDSVRSAPGSPFARTATESPPREFPDSHFVKSSDYDASPRTKQSDHGGAESLLSGDKSYDEPAWGTFDTNDDLDSIWGFNPLTTTEDNHERRIDPYSFESGELGLNPIRTGSPRADGFYPKRSPFFDDSVPSTPLFASVNSPRYSLGGNSPRYSMGGNSPRYSMGSEYSFDNFSRFDSFNMRDSGLFQPGETLARFDSMRSTKDFDYGRETLTRFDSIRSTNNFDRGHGFPSFDDADPFGSGGPFRTSSEGQTSKKGSENWRAF